MNLCRVVESEEVVRALQRGSFARGVRDSEVEWIGRLPATQGNSVTQALCSWKTPQEASDQLQRLGVSAVAAGWEPHSFECSG